MLGLGVIFFRLIVLGFLELFGSLGLLFYQIWNIFAHYFVKCISASHSTLMDPNYTYILKIGLLMLYFPPSHLLFFFFF